MKKNTWIKPEFEVETIDKPNGVGFLVEDTNHDGEFDRNSRFTTSDGITGEVTGGVDNVFPLGNQQVQLNSSFNNGGDITPKNHQFIESAVLFSQDQGLHWVSYNAIIADLEGEKNMMIFTSSSNNS